MQTIFKKEFKELKNLLSWDDSLEVGVYSCDEFMVSTRSIITGSSLRDIVFFCIQHNCKYYVTDRLRGKLSFPCIYIKFS